MDLSRHNKKAWNKEVEKENIWTRPVDSDTIKKAKRGQWEVFLTPEKPVPREWFPELSGKKVQGLASGGGQQCPIFAALGAIVTVFDNSPAQLEQDRKVAKRENLSLKLEEGDMRDLSRFPDGSFFLIFHPVSNCFIDDIKGVWKECFRVLKPGGILLSGFCNPVMYIFDLNEWEENNRLRVKYSIPYSDTEQLSTSELKARIKKEMPLEFGHSLENQIGGQLEAGFVITDFYEDRGEDFLDPYIPAFMATKAVKRSTTPACRGGSL